MYNVICIYQSYEDILTADYVAECDTFELAKNAALTHDPLVLSGDLKCTLYSGEDEYGRYYVDKTMRRNGRYIYNIIYYILEK